MNLSPGIWIFTVCKSLIILAKISKRCHFKLWNSLAYPEGRDHVLAEYGLQRCPDHLAECRTNCSKAKNENLTRVDVKLVHSTINKERLDVGRLFRRQMTDIRCHKLNRKFNMKPIFLYLGVFMSPPCQLYNTG